MGGWMDGWMSLDWVGVVALLAGWLISGDLCDLWRMVRHGWLACILAFVWCMIDALWSWDRWAVDIVAQWHTYLLFVSSVVISCVCVDSVSRPEEICFLTFSTFNFQFSLFNSQFPIFSFSCVICDASHSFYIIVICSDQRWKSGDHPYPSC